MSSIHVNRKNKSPLIKQIFLNVIKCEEMRNVELLGMYPDTHKQSANQNSDVSINHE